MVKDFDGLMRLSKAHIGPAADMLARSFQHDPKMMYFVPDTGERLLLSRHVLEFELNYGILYGEIYATSPDLEGVAVWLPSEKAEISMWRAIRAGGFRLQKNVGGDAMKKILSFSEYIDALHREHVSGTHTYLFFIGVDPAYQGKGYASRLIRPMLSRLDRAGVSCYLVTQNERNVALYEHYGFAVVGHTSIPGTEVGHWEMLRGATQ
jgi:ribosomal protein S18 acetylase RimI-like enzyme